MDIASLCYPVKSRALMSTTGCSINCTGMHAGNSQRLHLSRLMFLLGKGEIQRGVWQCQFQEGMFFFRLMNGQITSFAVTCKSLSSYNLICLLPFPEVYTVLPFASAVQTQHPSRKTKGKLPQQTPYYKKWKL